VPETVQNALAADTEKCARFDNFPGDEKRIPNGLIMRSLSHDRLGVLRQRLPTLQTMGRVRVFQTFPVSRLGRGSTPAKAPRFGGPSKRSVVQSEGFPLRRCSFPPFDHPQ